MVQLPNHGDLRADRAPTGGEEAVVKAEVDNRLEEDRGSLAKRSRYSLPLQQTCSANRPVVSTTLLYNPLDEPSPLGLRLKKSPSLLELIQLRLSQKDTSNSCDTGKDFDPARRKETKSAALSGTVDKLKASNFSASLLRIGSWECVSKYEGDLVAKCYYAKHKLVWEVLEGGLKSKIEIQWSDITALKASCPENAPGTLDIVLARLPLFFRETNPQPRKHTLWQATSDFTGGQASVHRRHFLQCPPGLLNKHFEKLIQCDPRLHSLSQKPNIILKSPYFEPQCSIFEDQVKTKCHNSFGNLGSGYEPGYPRLCDPVSACSQGTPSSGKSRTREQQHTRETDHEILRETPSPSSAIDSQISEDAGGSESEEMMDQQRFWDRIEVPGLRQSISMRDLANHLENCISAQMAMGNTGDAMRGKDMLEELTHYLLTDSQGFPTSDEFSLMSKVNSLCCLLQKDAVPSPQIINDFRSLNHHIINNFYTDQEVGTPDKALSSFPAPCGEKEDWAFLYRQQPPQPQQPSISRKDSFGELLLHLPRIASLPQFSFNVSEDTENQAR